MSERAFVAGATGYTGKEVVRVLRGASIDTLAHVRPDSPRLSDWRLRFEVLGARVDATPWTRDGMATTFARERPSLVFALHGTTRARMSAERSAGRDAATADYDAVDFGLTKLLLDALGDAGCRATRFVYLSAASVSPGARGAYLRARWRAEEAVRQSGLPFVVARPSFITGPDREESRPGERVGAALGDALLRVAGWAGATRLRERYRSTTSEALAAALVRWARDPEAVARIVESEDLRP